MSSATLEETELMIHSKKDIWNNSLESIVTQKITKITKSDTMFKLDSNFEFSELELRDTVYTNAFKSGNAKWEILRDTKIPENIRTRSLLRDELEMLKVDMSLNDKIVPPEESQVSKDSKTELKNIWKKSVKQIKWLEPPLPVQKLVSVKVKNILSEIEESEGAKTDAVVWKFLRRGPKIRKEYVKARKLFTEIQALHLPGLVSISNYRLSNPKPIKVTCPNCNFFVTTNIQKVSTVRTKITSFGLTIFGLCSEFRRNNTFRDTVHLCPLCKIYLGFCPALHRKKSQRKSLKKSTEKCEKLKEEICNDSQNMVSASSTSAKNLFGESKLRLSDRVQVNINNISAITRQIQRGSKANENIITAAKNFALQEAAIENSETSLKKLKLLSSSLHNQLDLLHNNSSKMELVLEQVRSMQR